VVDREAIPEELVAPIRPGEPACRFLAVRVLVREQGAPVTLIECPLIDGHLSGERLRRTIDRDLSETRELRGSGGTRSDILDKGGPDPREWPSVSVVVGTRERPDLLARCLRSLCALAYPDLEIIVADNGAVTDRTREVAHACDDHRVRYVHSDLKGVSAARNLGMAVSRGEIIAFADDDVIVDPAWLDGLVRGFERRADVGLVTGLVLPAELETSAQAMFERRVGWGTELNPRLFALDEPPPGDAIFPYSCGAVGAGASMAVRRRTVQAIGGFDEALGPGSLARAGEDLDYFLRVLVGGYAIAYEPTSLAWHRHRRDLDGLGQQLAGYGTGLAAFGFKQVLHRRTAALLARRLPSLLTYIMSDARRVSVAGEGLADAGPVPRSVRWKELSGMARGPMLYLRGRAAALRVAQAPRAPLRSARSNGGGSCAS
jgi:GT2 family glycosyltransferase